MRLRNQNLLVIFSFIALSVYIFSLPIPGYSKTIAPGEKRTVQGPVSAVDEAGRSLVLEVPISTGKWTVGVTITDSTKFPKGLSLQQLKVGETVRLEYVREGDRLIALSISKDVVAIKAKASKKESSGKADSTEKPAKETPAK
ncbi:MAG TPA: hypothetical protein VJM80_12880 [bacterium]|nr:hypothetical protein [bacterium]